MKGLMRNNYYAAFSNAKVFAIIMLLSGVSAVAVGKKSTLLMIGYMLLSMIGLSFNSIASLRKESTGKWSKYKLTAPVKRSAIVQSYFLSLLMWLIVGMIFAGIGAALSILLHGFPFDRNTDIFLLFTAGVGISLFMGAIFFPLFFAGGEERNEVFLFSYQPTGRGRACCGTYSSDKHFVPLPHDGNAGDLRQRNYFCECAASICRFLSCDRLYLS